MSYIEVENAGVIYNAGSDNEMKALIDINLKIEKDEFVIFFGPSGCGKTTLLNLISGLEKPSEGKVLVDGIDISGFDVDQMARFHCEKIGMVFQAYNLIPSLSVIDNVVLPRIFLGDSDKKSRKQRASSLLERFGVAVQAHKYPSQLSGGQQQRIGIARSLINDQPIILADEPVGNLDSKSAANVLDILRELNEKEGKTIIMVTHNAEHLPFADHIFYMKDGKVTDETFNHRKRDRKLEDMKPEEREFEILSRDFAGLSAAQINVMLTPFKAKAMASHLSNPLDYNQNQRLEEFISRRFSGDLSSEDFRLFLDKDYAAGGVGLDSRTAKKYALDVEDVIGNARILQADLSLLSSELQISEMDLRAKLIVRHLSESFVPEIRPAQFERFEKIVVQRLEGSIDAGTVFHLLDIPEGDSGVGLDLRVARKIVRELELLLLVKFGQMKKSGAGMTPDDKGALTTDDLARIERLLG